ncbi:uncharacterized protein LOC110728855 [Chenopodium quinoa]|uniref:uncharacterized protein LOC110728855 n=1 Tax=Chenopodium quinoa TaxID=63459 RepID=UPI000B77A65D|nr:uncharacterized protein LOC110728855 [Chenopodium quinoa]
MDEDNEEGYGLSMKSKVCRQKTMHLYPELFKDDGLSYGGAVKGRAEVMAEHSKARSRPPNMSCRIESFGRICQKFDDRRRRWVCEMGFGSLLHLALDMHLPRQLAYWVMTRMDPISKILRSTNGVEFRFLKNQVRWVLGIPMGPRFVPCTKTMTARDHEKVQRIFLKYGKSWESKKSVGQSGQVYTSVGIPLSSDMMNRLEGYFDAGEEEEFKTLFLIISLEMVLCPTQIPRLASDLLPAVSCAMEATEFDWCSLVLSKLLESLQKFARRFHANGFASGCGGCAIFAVIFYLDRLDRDPIEWDVFPGIKVWTMQQIGKAAKSDKLLSDDYGKLGLLDVAYGEHHPRDARDSVGPLQAGVNNVRCMINHQCLGLTSRLGKGGAEFLS